MQFDTLLAAAVTATFLAAAGTAAIAGGLATPAPAPETAKTGPYGCELAPIPGSNAYVRADPTCLANLPEGRFDGDVAAEHHGADRD